MLDLIPWEILRGIIDKIPHTQHRNSLSQVSKKLYATVLPTVYETITIRSKDEFDLEQTDIDKILKATDRHSFSYVKNILFIAPIEANDQFRCIHFKLFRDEDEHAIYQRDEELESRVDNLGDLMPQIRPLFQSIPDNHLKSFHWHLGTCIPKEILGPEGYLPTKQSSIEDLSFIMGDPCVLPKKDWEYQISLTKFKFLKKFSWSGGLSREYFHALRDMLSIQSNHLEVLKIDLIDWWDAQWNWCAADGDQITWIRDHNFFGERVLGLAPGQTRVLFPSLKSLSFSSVRFQHTSLEMAHAFNISRLRSLNLRDCPRSGSLLRKVVESGEPINLRSLELVIRHSSSESYRQEVDQDWIVLFLNSFEGLRNLHLLVLNERNVADMHRYWPSIFHHKKTLTRLVYHERRFDHEWMDRNTTMENDKIKDLFTQMDLECIGICVSPVTPTQQAFLQLTLAQVSTLRFLCVRTTGLDAEFEHPFEYFVDGNDVVHGFARWAFKFFPKLLFIAIGDFSYGRQFASKHEILRRYPFPGVERGVENEDGLLRIQPATYQNQSDVDGFRRVHTGDRISLAHLEKFRDVLEACPAEPLYLKDF